MFRTSDRGQRRRTRFRRTLAAAVSSMIAIIIGTGLVGPVGAGDRAAVQQYDRRVLSEIARDVLRGGVTDPNQSVAEPSFPGGGSAPGPEHDSAVSEREPDEATPATHIAPPRKGIVVPFEPGTRAPKIVVPETGAAAGYHSNSWRQGTDSGRGLSFSSGRLAPATGLDPALASSARGLRGGDGRQYVYGFLLLRAPADEALEKKLAGLDVELLGPHDDHHKARLPMALLPAIAALPEVEWLGVSSREQKLSRELAALRGLRGRGRRRRRGRPDSDRRQSLRRRRQRQLPASTGGRRRHARAVRCRPSLLSRGGHRSGHRHGSSALDFVLFVELIRPDVTHPRPEHAAHRRRPDPPGHHHYGLPRFGGSPIPVGIMDSGFRMGVRGHDDLYFKNACGRNFTDDGLGAFNDEHGHGTHVLGIIAGTGAPTAATGAWPRPWDSSAAAASGPPRSSTRCQRSRRPAATSTGKPRWTGWPGAGRVWLPAAVVVNCSGGWRGTT